MAEYENLRMRKIQENKKKMEQLRLKPLAYESMSLINGKKKKISNTMKSKQVIENDDYCTLEESDHLEESTELGDIERVQTVQNLRPCSKKVIACGGGSIIKSVQNQQSSKTTMASLIKTRSQSQNLLQQVKEKKQHDVTSLQIKQQEKYLTPLARQVHSEQNGRVSAQPISNHNLGMTNEKSLSMQSQHAVENNTPAKKGQSKTMVAPGTLGVFLRMRGKSTGNGRLSDQIDSFDKIMEISRKRQASCSGLRLSDGDTGCEFGIVNGDDGSQPLNDFVVEEEQVTDPTAQNANESIPVQEQQTHELGKILDSRGRQGLRVVFNWSFVAQS